MWIQQKSSAFIHLIIAEFILTEVIIESFKLSFFYRVSRTAVKWVLGNRTNHFLLIILPHKLCNTDWFFPNSISFCEAAATSISTRKLSIRKCLQLCNAGRKYDTVGVCWKHVNLIKRREGKSCEKSFHARKMLWRFERKINM